MNLLLDTHILLWALSDDPRLSDKTKELLLDEANSIYYSAISVWEVAIKHAIHPDNVQVSGKDFAMYCREAGYSPLEMREKHVAALETIVRREGAPPHQDPFDRMLIAQAKEENMSFITHDLLLSYYDEKCLILV